MDIVIDANILFSALIKSGKSEELLFESDLHLYAPEFIFDEFDKYKDDILKKTQRTSSDFVKLLTILKKRIKTIPNEEIEKYLSEATKASPDPGDVDYIALALKLKCSLWSQDKIPGQRQPDTGRQTARTCRFHG